MPIQLHESNSRPFKAIPLIWSGKMTIRIDMQQIRGGVSEMKWFVRWLEWTTKSAMQRICRSSCLSLINSIFEQRIPRNYTLLLRVWCCKHDTTRSEKRMKKKNETKRNAEIFSFDMCMAFVFHLPCTSMRMKSFTYKRRWETVRQMQYKCCVWADYASKNIQSNLVVDCGSWKIVRNWSNHCIIIPTVE